MKEWRNKNLFSEQPGRLYDSGSLANQTLTILNIGVIQKLADGY
jgi:hypothetical protein